MFYKHKKIIAFTLVTAVIGLAFIVSIKYSNYVK